MFEVIYEEEIQADWRQDEKFFRIHAICQNRHRWTEMTAITCCYNNKTAQNTHVVKESILGSLPEIQRVREREFT